MTSFVGVLPFVHQPYRDACVATMHPDFRKNVLEVDNTVNNLGIMKSHNLGIERMFNEGADWLIVMSAAIRFGKAGGMDFVKEIEKRPNCHVVQAIGPISDELGQRLPYGWHLIAFNKRVFEEVGTFDENFTPYSLDDIDLSLRIQKYYGDTMHWDIAPCDVSDTTHAHSLNLGGVKATYEPRNKYFTRKWGRDGGEWNKPAYDTPFDSGKPLSWWPKPDDPLSIDQVEFNNGRDY